MLTEAQQAFLVEAGWAGGEVTAIAPDASSRSYFRIRRKDGWSAILMVTPQDTEAGQTTLRAFLRVASFLEEQGFSTPGILYNKRDAGLTLLEDFGQTDLAQLLTEDASTAQEAYGVAGDVISALAQVDVPEWAMRADIADVVAMIDLSFDQFNVAPDLRSELTERFTTALGSVCTGPGALSLRDVHAENLMWLPERHGIQRIGLLDFQDALVLPLGYDLASLVDDPRREVPEAWREALIVDASRAAGLDVSDYARRVNLLSLIRNLRILGIFHRLSTEAGRPKYRGFLPRTHALITRAASAPGLGDMRAAIQALLEKADRAAEAAL